MLFAYLPTQKETHLKFLIQARYQTTPARDNIPKPSENPWNRWLVKETANYLPEILEQLKTSGLLEPAFFNILPLKGEVENEFKPIAEALQKAMQERALVPTQSGGYAKANSKGIAIPRDIEYKYAKAQNVYYPHVEILRQLIENNWLNSESSWLHPEIRDTDEFRQCFKVMREAGVKEVAVSRVLEWLEERELDWFEAKSYEWLRFLYTYLKEQKSHSERIKKLPLIRLENGQHVCASNALVFLPPDTDERRAEIKPFLSNLPVLQSTLLKGEERNEIEAFFKSLGVRELQPEGIIREWIIPQYSQSNKPSAKENLLHVRYLFKVWDKFSGYGHRSLKEEIGKTPILQVYNGAQPETFDFVKPCDAYLPQAYTGDTDLETYFSVSNGEYWFVDSRYLDGYSNPKGWLKFLREIGAMDTPRVDKIEVTGNCEECQKRGITRERSTREFENGNFIDRYYSGHFDGAIEDFEFAGLLEVFNQISDHNKVNLSRSLWNLLIKAIEPLPSEKKSRWPQTSSRDAFFQCTYHRFYRDHLREFFDATFYRQLKETAWLPDEQGNLQVPINCFAPTDDNRKVLSDSVAYLHPDFDISENNETARWLAEKLGIHLNANTESVLHYLQTLSGTEVNVEKVEPLYRFLDGQGARRSEEFKQKPLIFTANPESHWWRSDEVFWEDKNEVLEKDRRCLKAHYPATLRYFFITLGVLEQASQRDYACRIQEIATTEQAADKKVCERLRRLYKCLTTSQKHEWEIIYDERCWLGKTGEEWGFFTRQELVLKDHPHIGEIFEGKVPFWTFGGLSDLTTYLEIEGCSQAKGEFDSEGDQEENTDWSEKVRNLRRYIYAFLHSPLLSEKPETEKFVEVLDQLSVCRVKELKVTYKLKGTPVPDRDPRPSFLDEQEAKLWLGLEENEDEYPELIGDALQDYFGVSELGRFVQDLLTPRKKQDRVLFNWKRKGLETKFLDEDPKDDEEKQIESLDEKLPDEPNGENADPVVDESDPGIPTDNGTSAIDKTDSRSTSEKSETDIDLASRIDNTDLPDMQVSTKTEDLTSQSTDIKSGHEVPKVNESLEVGNRDPNSTTKESGSHTYTPSKTSGTSQSGGHWKGTSNSDGSGVGGHGSHSGGGESEEHRTLKEYLADNPAQFGVGLKLVEIEYTFGSGDRVDILLKDGFGNPVTVEVETGFSSGTGKYVGVWQAVKYQHLAAMECGLACEEVRSILAAPEIPEDVKEKCKELGIEPVEVAHLRKNQGE